MARTPCMVHLELSVLCSPSSIALGWIWFRRSLPQRGTIYLSR